MKPAGRTLDEWADRFREGEAGREEATSAFVSIGSPAVATLTTLLDVREQPITRAGAASALWLLRQRASAAAPTLENVLAHDPDVVVRLRAAQALTGIVPRYHARAVAYLREIARSTDDALAGWIRAEATAILREAGLQE